MIVVPSECDMLILAAIARRERCLPVTNGDGKKTVAFSFQRDHNSMF